MQDAARIKAQLQQLEADLGPQPIESDVRLQTGSDAVTAGVRIKIQSTYRPADSAPHLNQFFFR